MLNMASRRKQKVLVVTASLTTVSNVSTRLHSYSTGVNDGCLKNCTDGGNCDRWGGVRRQQVGYQSRDENGDEMQCEDDRSNACKYTKTVDHSK